MQIVATISQLLIYNTCSGTHHARQTCTIRHGKDQKHLFLYFKVWRCTGNMAAKQIETTHALCLSVSYSRIMEVKQAIAWVVCKHYAQDGIVLLTNLRISVFVNYDVDNLVGQNKGNFSQSGFHGTAISVTNHLSWHNLMGLIGSPTHNLPDSYAAAPCAAGRVHYTLCTLELTIDPCGHYIISSIMLRWKINIDSSMSAAYCSKESP